MSGWSVGDLVWGKLRGWPWWPAVISLQQGETYTVTFFPNNDTAVVHDDQIVPFKENIKKFSKPKMKPSLRRGIEEAKKYKHTESSQSKLTVSGGKRANYSTTSSPRKRSKQTVEESESDSDKFDPMPLRSDLSASDTESEASDGSSSGSESGSENSDKLDYDAHIAFINTVKREMSNGRSKQKALKLQNTRLRQTNLKLKTQINTLEAKIGSFKDDKISNQQLIRENEILRDENKKVRKKLASIEKLLTASSQQSSQ